MLLKYALGIDVSSQSLQCCLSVIDIQQTVKVKATHSFSNSLTGFKQLDHWIKKHYKEKQVPLVIGLEATGVYYEACALYLFKAGYQLSVLLPNKARRYMQSLGLKSKNDSIDAKGLSRMAAEQQLSIWQPMSEFYFSLRGLSRQLQSLQEAKTSFDNQLHAAQQGMYPNKMLLKQLKSIIRALEKNIGQLKQAIEAHLYSDEQLWQRAQKLCSVKGVGLHTVAVLLAETNGFALIENQSQLVSYAGYDVVESQSGSRAGKTRISKKGNPRIRRMLYMPAFNVVKYEVKPFQALYSRTYQRHGIKMKSYVAVQKKLLVLLYALWKKDACYDEQYIVSNSKMAPAEHPAIQPIEEVLQKSSPAVGKATQGRPTPEVLEVSSM